MTKGKTTLSTAVFDALKIVQSLTRDEQFELIEAMDAPNDSGSRGFVSKTLKSA